MQIDFHYDVIYVLARYAGFEREEAKIIAHSSQYVDDAENGGFIRFTNQPSYYHIRTAHKVFDKDNLDPMSNLFAWVPFHFLPGNLCVGEKGKDKYFVSKLVCRENSEIANEMMEECIKHKSNNNSLHRLGLSLHVYADTWAHQNFVGLSDEINCTNELHVLNKETEIFEKITSDVKKLLIDIENVILDDLFPLGHGTAHIYPDLPYLKWRYTDYLGNESPIIDNCDRFIRAAREVYKYMKRYQIGDPKAIVDKLPEEGELKIKALFQIAEEDKLKRHNLWQAKLEENYFGFNDGAYPYVSYGPDSWKSIALNKDVSKDDKNDIYTIDQSFVNSDWKMFHDAAKEHWDFVINHLLPKHEVII